MWLLGGHAQMPLRAPWVGEGRVLASSCDTGMYFYALFPTYRYIDHAHALHKVTLPDSSKVHPPNVLTSPRPFSPAARIGERPGAQERRTPSTRAREARRGTRPRSASPLALPQNQPSTQHPPSPSVLHTIPHPHTGASFSTMRNSSVVVETAQLLCATPGTAAGYHARISLSFPTLASILSIE